MYATEQKPSPGDVDQATLLKDMAEFLDGLNPCPAGCDHSECSVQIESQFAIFLRLYSVLRDGNLDQQSDPCPALEQDPLNACQCKGYHTVLRIKTCPYHCPGGMKKWHTDQKQNHTGMPFHKFYRIAREILSARTAPEAVQNIIKDLDNQQASDDIMKELGDIMAEHDPECQCNQCLRFRTQVLSSSLSLSPAVCAFRV